MVGQCPDSDDTVPLVDSGVGEGDGDGVGTGGGGGPGNGDGEGADGGAASCVTVYG